MFSGDNYICCRIMVYSAKKKIITGSSDFLLKLYICTVINWIVKKNSQGSSVPPIPISVANTVLYIVYCLEQKSHHKIKNNYA